MKKLLSFTFILLLICFPSAKSNYQTTNENQNKKELLKTSVISVFKNGIAFVQKSGQFVLKNGKAEIEIPIVYKDVIFGTVWFSSPNNIIRNINSSVSSKSIESVANSIKEMCKANINKDISFKLKSYDQAVDGKIISVEDDVIQIETKGKWIITTMSDILHLEFKEKPSLIYYTKEITKSFDIEFENKTATQQIDLLYMQKGIIWTPSYNVQLIDDKKGKLILQANLINDIEDFENVKLNFIVGVPSFLHKNIMSPLFSLQDITEYISSLTASSNTRFTNANQFDNNNMMSQTTYDQVNIQSNQVEPNNEETTSNEGLFFYKKDNITIKKGGRALFTLLETDFDYEQVYSVDLKPNENFYSSYRSRENTTENNTAVWHSIKFLNKTKSPFTTGSIFITKKSENEIRPISQNIIKYTAPGALATVKTTISPDINVTDDDKEIARKENAIEHHNLITIETTINIVNYKTKDIKLEVYRTITGELLKSNIPWKSESKLRSWNSKNKQNETLWELEVKAGETKKIVYSYQIYVWR